VNNQKKKICVTGLGCIGLPTACLLANSGYQVLGVDIDRNVLKHIGSGQPVYEEPGLQDLLMTAIHMGMLKTSTHVEAADIHIISVPTPIDSNNQPDLSSLYDAVEAICPHLRENDLVLIESTCPIGTTQSIADILKASCLGVKVAYCPERVLPGNILSELIKNDRVVGGINATSTKQAITFYHSFVQGDVIETDVRTAEAVKLAENTYRDVNIAYANELSMIADRLKLNVVELIRIANRHPRVNILNPGPGVGGHCIAVDPWFLVSSAPDLASIITCARNVNTKKIDWVVQKIRRVIKKENAKVIACLGLTYKKNVSDVRGSPAFEVVKTLEKEIEVLRIDPYYLSCEESYTELSRAEIIVGLVAHDAFKDIPEEYLVFKTILDFAAVFE